MPLLGRGCRGRRWEEIVNAGDGRLASQFESLGSRKIPKTKASHFFTTQAASKQGRDVNCGDLIRNREQIADNSGFGFWS